MWRFLLNRFLKIPFTLFVVSLICFFCIKTIPYNPVDFILNLEKGEAGIGSETDFNADAYDQLSKKLGLDKPIFYFSILPSHYLAESQYEYPQSFRDKISVLEKKGYNPSMSHWENKTYLEVSKLQGNKKIALPKFYWNGLENQYHSWVSNLLLGDFGLSYLDNRPVRKKISEALKWTLSMIFLALFVSFVIGISMGIISFMKPDNIAIRNVNRFGYFMYIMPLFWIATVALVFFTTDDYGTWTNWFASSNVYIDNNESFLSNLIQHFEILILPVITLSIGSLIYIARQMQNALEEERDKLYTDVAKIKGLGTKDIVIKHQLRNALLPMITLFTSALPASLAGSLIVETIFNIPGMGRLLFNSIELADWNVVYAIILLTAVITSLSYTLADILYYKANPKIKLG